MLSENLKNKNCPKYVNIIFFIQVYFHVHGKKLSLDHSHISRVKGKGDALKSEAFSLTRYNIDRVHYPYYMVF